MITNLYKTAPTAVNYLTYPLTTYKIKEQKYKEKQKSKWAKELSPQQVKHLKSALSQAFVITQLQIECIDTIFEIQHVEKHFPLLKDFQNEMLNLESELRQISIKDESGDANRLQIEKMIEGIVKEMPTMNIKQLQMLQEFTTNLKFKK